MCTILAGGEGMSMDHHALYGFSSRQIGKESGLVEMCTTRHTPCGQDEDSTLVGPSERGVGIPERAKREEVYTLLRTQILTGVD